MIGINFVSGYVPYFRVERSEITNQWGIKLPEGLKPVCSCDEDSLTLAYDVSKNLSERPDALIFATTTPPYIERPTSTTLCSALDLEPKCFSLDVIGSVGSGVSALITAISLVKSGDFGRVLVVGADTRNAEPFDEYDGLIGDGAGAVLVGDFEEPMFSVEFRASTRDETYDSFRRDGQRFSELWEDRHTAEWQFVSLLKRYGEILKDAKVVISSPSIRLKRVLGKMKVELEDELAQKVGFIGAGYPFASLAFISNKLEKGDRVALVGLSGGLDIVVLKVEREDATPSDELKKLIEGGGKISYGIYLRLRRYFERDLIPDQPTSLMVLSRETKQNLRFYGQECKKCGNIQFPMQTACTICGSRSLDERKLSRKGKVFTLTRDYLTEFSEVMPPVVMAVIDLDGGGRVYLQVTGTEPYEISISDEVELTLRRVQVTGNFINYFWKARKIE